MHRLTNAQWHGTTGWLQHTVPTSFLQNRTAPGGCPWTAIDHPTSLENQTNTRQVPRYPSYVSYSYTKKAGENEYGFIYLPYTRLHTPWDKFQISGTAFAETRGAHTNQNGGFVANSRRRDIPTDAFRNTFDAPSPLSSKKNTHTTMLPTVEVHWLFFCLRTVAA